MARLYCTPDPAAAAISAAQRARTLLRLLCYSPIPLRVRKAKIPEGTIILRNNDLYKRELSRWHDGLIASWRPENDFPHDVQVMAEMPLSVASYDEATSATEKAVVIFRPPTWRGHHAAVEHFWPSVERVKRLEKMLRTQGRNMPTVGMEMLSALGIGHANMGFVSDRELRERLDIQPRGFTYLRRAVMAGNASRPWHQVRPIICRIAPHDRTLAPVYKAISLLPKVGKYHLALGAELHKTSKNWPAALRKLERCGSIERSPRLWFYYTGFGRPDYEGIEKANSDAKAALAEMIYKVESALVFPIKEKPHA